MNKNGFMTAIKVAEKYFGIRINSVWIEDNIERINEFFPQDRGYAFTFQGECERNTLSDTYPRWAFMDAISTILTGQRWPTLCDRTQYDEFFIEFKTAINNAKNITLIEEKIC